MAVAKQSMASLKREVVRLEAESAKLAKDLASEKSSKELWYKSAQEKEAEINAVHDLLDVLPNTIARRKDGDYSPEHKLMTRLASFLANRG